uniref:Uncharacterized protein n=1 Tax=Anguilla anguilla TaxID=7936 RepID=A0A0E9U3D5_ANGAN
MIHTLIDMSNSAKFTMCYYKIMDQLK